MSGAALAQLAMLCTVNKPPGAINPRLRCISCTDSTILIYPNTQSRDISSARFLVNHHAVQYEVKRCCLNETDKRVYVCMSAWVVRLLVFEWQRALLPGGDEFALDVFLHLCLSCGSAAYPVCAQCCLRLMFAPSATTSSAPAVKHQRLHKVIFRRLWYKFASVSILSCFIRHQSTRIFQVSVK